MAPLTLGTSDRAGRGRVFASPHDFNRQLSDWLVKANTRLVRRIGARPTERIGADRAAMLVLPPVVPQVGIKTRVRLPRDGTVNLTVGVSRYGRIAGCEIRQLACPATDFR
jgi:hypothetical protein